MTRPLLCVALAAFVFLPTSKAAEFLVPDNYATIQAAMDAAGPGDTVRVRPGTYEESLQFKDGIHLDGDDRATTIVQCPSDQGSALWVGKARGGTVRGLTFRHEPALSERERAMFRYPLVMVYNSSIGMEDCAVENSGSYGILVYGGEPTFDRCTVTNSRRAGVYCFDGNSRPRFSHCAISKSGDSGMVIDGPGMVAEVSECVVEDNDGVGFDADMTVRIDGTGNDFVRNRYINYEEVWRLFMGGEFQYLEAMHDHLLENKTRSRNGSWQLDYFYGWLERSARYLDTEEKKLATIEAWKAAYPESTAWRVFLAKHYYGEAWKRRGSGYANTVSEKGWEGYGEYMERAWAIVDEIAKLRPKDPEYYCLRASLSLEMPRPVAIDQEDPMRTVALLREDPARAAFMEGIALEPLYFPLYYGQVRNLLPQWGGSIEAIVHLAEQSADNTKDVAGETLYAVVASRVLRYARNDEFLNYGFSWERIQAGYERLLQDFPDGSYRRNLYAYLACLYGDRAKAAEIFQKINQADTDSVWRGQGQFEAYKNWAINGGEFPEDSSLYLAVRDNDESEVARLLAKGADPNQKTTEGLPMVMLALYNKAPQVVRLLLRAGADPNQVEPSRGMSALALALAKGEYETAKSLLEAGADPNLGVDSEFGPLAVAVRKRNTQWVQLLLEHGADPNLKGPKSNPPLMTAVTNQDGTVCTLLMDHGADPNVRNGNGATAIFAAAQVGSLPMAKWLVEHGADIDVTVESWSVYHMAAAAGSMPVLKYLLERNPDGLHAKTDGGGTLLHEAVKAGNPEMVAFLLDSGLDPNNVDPQTSLAPLAFAQKYRLFDVVTVLREHGATESMGG